MKVELDFSNYAIKADLKNATCVDISKFAKKVDLGSLKSNVDKLDVDKLVPVPADLNKLSDVVKDDVVKKCVCNAHIKSIENKIPDINKKISKNDAINLMQNADLTEKSRTL